MIDKAEIERRVRNIVIEHLGVELADGSLAERERAASRDKNLYDDLKADSLDVVELIMAAEEEFAVEILDEEFTKIQTVGDFADLVAGKAPQ